MNNSSKTDESWKIWRIIRCVHHFKNSDKLLGFKKKNWDTQWWNSIRKEKGKQKGKQKGFWWKENNCNEVNLWHFLWSLSSFSEKKRLCRGEYFMQVTTKYPNRPNIFFYSNDCHRHQPIRMVSALNFTVDHRRKMKEKKREISIQCCVFVIELVAVARWKLKLGLKVFVGWIV